MCDSLTDSVCIGAFFCGRASLSPPTCVSVQSLVFVWCSSASFLTTACVILSVQVSVYQLEMHTPSVEMSVIDEQNARIKCTILSLLAHTTKGYTR